MHSGYTIVERNWRFRAPELRGELDVIARRGDLVVICEVKTRRNAAYGGGAGAVDAAKQDRIRQLAQMWLIERGWGDLDVRFDVIAINGVDLQHYEAAF